MKMFKKNFVVTVLVAFFVFAMFGLIAPNAALAATSPTLGAAATFSILAQTAIDDAVAASVISGDVGMNASGASITGLTATQVGPPGLIYATAPLAGPAEAIIAPAVNANVLTAYGDLTGGTNADANCMDPTTLVPGSIAASGTNLGGLSLAPGLYCSAGIFNLIGTLNLTGTTGTWVFKAASALTTSPGSSVTGGDACNVWWRVGSLATLAGTSFKGSILSGTGVHITTAGILDGRALATGGDVTMVGSTTISGPVCSAAPSGGSRVGTINVVKHVINDNGGTKTVADFPLFVNGASVVSGVTNTFTAPATAYTVTETTNSGYTRTFSGDCDINGQLNLNPGDNKFCIITNDDIGAPAVPLIPPLIDVVKVPNPLSLPLGSGSVTYTYTLRNIGTVPVTNITMVGDTCSPIVLQSGDTNGDAKLDLNEIWVHTCTTTLTETHTNTVTATGWANGISAVDIASATVVVGLPIVPPLIHITKVPNPLTLGSGGGMVTYTKRVTNPGTVALNNVSVADDKCSPVTYISGDTNGDAKLDPTETWTYTCRMNLIRTTTNTATATGTANGLTARDFAIATVVVASTIPVANVVPALPNTGVAPAVNVIAWIVFVAGIFAVLLTIYFIRKKQIE